jgi:hypothetical protein
MVEIYSLMTRFATVNPRASVIKALIQKLPAIDPRSIEIRSQQH